MVCYMFEVKVKKLLICTKQLKLDLVFANIKTLVKYWALFSSCFNSVKQLSSS